MSALFSMVHHALPVTFTVFQSTAPLSKAFGIDEAGAIVKAAAEMTAKAPKAAKGVRT
jgi:hypothetical protein